MPHSFTHSKVYDILPPPFEWIDIPGGTVMLEANRWGREGEQTCIISDFTIAKYLITNLQFTQFVQAGGYQNPSYWTQTGWQQCQKGQWAEPKFWQDTRFKDFKQDDYPVVGVSWYEAIAFCHWLSEVSGERISLPTEPQWQRAAQGDDGRKYPWGDVFDKTRCNNRPSHIYQPTPVTRYLNGASPYGVLDMVGNASEWCLTKSTRGRISDNEEGDVSESRALRGGSWRSSMFPIKVTYRVFATPYVRSPFDGFRIVRLPSPT